MLHKLIIWFQATILVVGAVVIVTNLASAQVVPIETVAGYKIARIESANVCFAVVNIRSRKNYDMAFSYYRSKTGQRWQVGGYLSALDHSDPKDRLTISFDGDQKLSRDVEFRDGDFIVPFEALAELQAFERDVEKGKTLVFGFKQDSLEIPLPAYRQAIKSVISCAAAIE